MKEQDPGLVARQAEIQPKAERKSITPSTILESNRSPKAQENIRIFDQLKQAGNAVDIDWGCGDARLSRLLARQTFFFYSIANGGNPRDLRGAVESRAVGRIFVNAHEPVCGGRNAKASQIQNGDDHHTDQGINGFVYREIDHPSVIQAGIQARKIASYTDKLVVATVENHTNGTRRVMAIFNRKDNGPVSALPREAFDNPTPATTRFDSWIPYLKENELPSGLEEYRKAHEAERKQLFSANPNLSKELVTQNPRMIKLSDTLCAAEVWIPDFAGPGNIFRLTTPRHRILNEHGEKRTEFTKSDIQQAFAQAQYAIHYAIENGKKPGAQFSDTNTFLISTSDWNLSQSLAFNLAQQEFMHTWLQDERNNILVSQNNAGNIRRIGAMKFTVSNGFVQRFEVKDVLAT